MKFANQLKELKERTSEKFIEQIEQYILWAENTDQAELLDVGFMENQSFFSVVIVTSENIVQLIYNKDNETITVGTASRDACEYAMATWGKKAQQDKQE